LSGGQCTMARMQRPQESSAHATTMTTEIAQDVEPGVALVPAGQGDVWSKSYSKTHPWLSSCELCGAKPTRNEDGSSCTRRKWYAATNAPHGKFVIMTWDHCHAHNIVRGTLCGTCNIEEETDRHTHHWGERFTKWRTRCPLCVEAGQLGQHDREGCSVCWGWSANRGHTSGTSATPRPASSRAS